METSLMTSLWLYGGLSRLSFMNYRAKIMIVAFAGTHIPLIAIVANIAWQYSDDWQGFLGILATALAATLGGTAATLFVLVHLLRPVVETSRALTAYGENRAIVPLPTHYPDEVGTLMANTVTTLSELRIRATDPRACRCGDGPREPDEILPRRDGGHRPARRGARLRDQRQQL